jgi:hypothetical protein
MPMTAAPEFPRLHASGGTTSVRGLLAVAVVGAALALGPGPASAQQNPCGDAGGACQDQVQPGVFFDVLQSLTLMMLCEGDHSHFQPGIGGVQWDNTCFSVIEDIFSESDGNFHGIFTNWCTSTQTVVVTLACVLPTG